MGTAGSQPSSPSSPSSSSSAAAAAAVTSVVSSALHSRSNTTHKKNKKKTMAAAKGSQPAAPYVRRAHHAGSWYESSKSMLDAELTEYLTAAADEQQQQQQQQQQAHDAAVVVENGSSKAPASGTLASHRPMPRAIVSPHAGYRYSGPTAAHAYLALREAVMQSRNRVRTVVVLHPSHHVRLDGCALSGATTIETPLANLLVDDDLRTELLSTGQFTIMDRRVDEHEHSGEMQYSYVAKVLNDAKAAAAGGRAAQSPEAGREEDECHQCRILPIMVGALNAQKERHYGRLLGPILSRSDVFTVISSDFCHWGQRFGYMPLPPPPVGNSSKCDDGRSSRNGIRATSKKQQHQQTVVQEEEIYQYIQRLDEIGMDHISLQNPGAFAEYLRHYSNTICGRHPIGVWLNSLVCNRDAGRETVQVQFVKYDQSGQVTSVDESSVSYASAVAREVMS